MSLSIDSSKIVNTVTFKVDNSALDAAKKSIKSIQQYAENIQPAMNMGRWKAQMREMEDYLKRLEAARRGAGPNPPPPPPNGGGGNGGNGGGGGRRGNAKERRAETARLRRDNFNYRSAEFDKVSSEQLAAARNIVEQTISKFEQEGASIARVNQVIAQQLNELRKVQRMKNRIAEEDARNSRRAASEAERERKRLERLERQQQRDAARREERERNLQRRERERRRERIRDGALGLNSNTLAGGLIGAAAYEGINKIRETLANSAERITLSARGGENVGANANAILAMTYWGQNHGIDSARINKSVDNLKDVRDRIGDTIGNSTFNQKTGKWTGGDSGINTVMNRYGWNLDDIKKFKNDSLGFISATVNAGQARGDSNAEIGSTLETFGDDLIYYLPMFLNSGKEFMNTIDQMKSTGAILTQEQVNAAESYRGLATQLNMISDGMGANFLTGFIGGLGNSTADFQKNVQTLDATAKWLGDEVGDVAKQLSNFVESVVGAINGIKSIKDGTKNFFDAAEHSANDPNRNDPDYVDPMSKYEKLDPMDLVKQWWNNPSAWWNDGASSDNSNTSSAKMFTDSANNFSNPVGYQNPVVVQNMIQLPSDAFNVNIIPDGTGISDYFRSQIDTSLDTFNSNLTLDLQSGTSRTGS